MILSALLLLATYQQPEGLIIRKSGTPIQTLATIKPDGTVEISPAFNTCPEIKLRKNLRAAAKGSRRAQRYIRDCADKVNSQY